MQQNASLPLAIHGAAGRLGSALVDMALKEGSWALEGATVSPASRLLGQPLSPNELALTYQAELPPKLPAGTVVIDVSRAEAVAAHAAQAAQAGWPLIVGVTGLDAVTEVALAAAAERIPVLLAPNFSLGVALLRQLVQDAALVLGPDFDIGILDVHHRHKRDAPSGTGRSLSEALAAVGRSAEIVSQRLGAVIGDHTVSFAGPGERLVLSHQAEDRALFARGALAAAQFLRAQPPGTFEMADVLAARRALQSFAVDKRPS
jgi:4-hydroxy-tetrahydrodipicolinate reductase